MKISNEMDKLFAQDSGQIMRISKPITEASVEMNPVVNGRYLEPRRYTEGQTEEFKTLEKLKKDVLIKIVRNLSQHIYDLESETVDSKNQRDLNRDEIEKLKLKLKAGNIT